MKTILRINGTNELFFQTIEKIEIIKHADVDNWPLKLEEGYRDMFNTGDAVKLNFDHECQSFSYDIRYDSITVCSKLIGQISSYEFSSYKKAFSAYSRIEKKLDSCGASKLDSSDSLMEILKAFNTQSAVIEVNGMRKLFNKKELSHNIDDLFNVIMALKS